MPPLLCRFRWVFCQLEVLRHCFPANLRRTLEELPKSLDETYKRILSEINNANWVHAYRLLQCLTVARRPLRVEELAEVLAFDLTTGGLPKLNTNWRWEDQEEAVLSACSSLVSVIIDNGSRVVQFSHFSVKEFLISNRLSSCKEEVSQFHIPIESSHAILAQACIGVLLSLGDRTDGDSVNDIPLYRYTCEYWVEHAKFGNVESHIKDALDYFFDMGNPHFSAWVRIEHPRDFLRVSTSEVPTGAPRSAAPLYFAAWRGLHRLVERLIVMHPRQVHQLGGFHGTPLHASVLGGYIEVSRLLFTHGADINACCADGLTPLHIALRDGHLEIGKWLLDHGADVTCQTTRGSTPLHFAIECGHIEVCRMVLERNADFNSLRNSNGSTPLLLALERGHPIVAQLLLDHNADVHARSNSRSSPLHIATSKGYLEVARTLLERNAEVDLPNYHGSTPLLLASELGHTDIVHLLLDHNADLDARDADGDSPLHCAAYNGQLEVARILLKFNVEVDSRNNMGMTPLHRALMSFEEGSTGVVRLLLDCGADVQARNLNGETASEVASGPEQQEILRLHSQHSVD